MLCSAKPGELGNGLVSVRELEWAATAQRTKVHSVAPLPMPPSPPCFPAVTAEKRTRVPGSQVSQVAAEPPNSAASQQNAPTAAPVPMQVLALRVRPAVSGVCLESRGRRRSATSPGSCGAGGAGSALFAQPGCSVDDQRMLEEQSDYFAEIMKTKGGDIVNNYAT